MKKLLKSPLCSIIVFLVVFLTLTWMSKTEAREEPNWRWILTDVYWNKSGGQVCEFRRINGREIRRIVRHRGYGCANKSMNPYNEP